MSPNDGSANLLLGITPPWLQFGARRRKASPGSGRIRITSPHPSSSTSNKSCRREHEEAHGEGIRVVHYKCLVADHGHLVHVCVVGQLREHKGRNIRTRYRLSCVRTSEKNVVFALGRFVSEPRRTHDYPIEVALFDRLFLALLVVVDVLHHERPDDPIVEKTDVTLAVTDSDAGYADQATHPVLVHRADEVVRTLREKGCSTRAARPQRREHGVLAGYGRLDLGGVQRIPLQHPGTVVFWGHRGRVAGQCRYFVALL